MTSGVVAPTYTPATFPLVVVAASTGGPPALRRLAERLPYPLPAAVLVVQHIAAGFTSDFAAWLGNGLPFPVRLATAGERVTPGVVLIAPDNRHLRISPQGRVVLDGGPAAGVHCPSADELFTSAASFGARVLGVVLTGMGQDGAAGASAIRRAGGYVLAESAETATVFGMPRAARLADAVDEMLPLDLLCRRLRQLVLQRSSGAR